MKKYRTAALAGVVVLAAAAALLVSSGGDEKPRTTSAVSGGSDSAPPPQVELVPGTGEVEISLATPNRTAADVQAPGPDPTDDPVSSGLPGAKPGAYELAEPGDRTPAPPPDFFRTLSGSIDKRSPLFASHCPYSHSRTDDPIVFPRQSGGSHLHDFFGNRATDAFSTDDSLRTAGRSTCNFPGDSAAYWAPALYQDGGRIKPDSLNAYYTPGVKDHRTIEPFPRGLKILANDPGANLWYCVGQRANATYSKDPPLCGMGQHLGLQIVFPDCWDGKYLNVPDHKQHMAYAASKMCPMSHPVPVPQLVLFIDYMSARGGNVVLAPKNDPSTLHGDFVNAWDQAMLTKFVRDCINSGVHCGGTPPN